MLNNFSIIYNPNAGAHNNCDKLEILLNFLKEEKINYKMYQTKSVGHATKIIANIQKKNDSGNILVCGGDGTLNEVINGMHKFENFNFGILPFGSGNDFLKNLSDNDDIVFLVKKFIKGKVCKVSYLNINNKVRCINILGLGMQAEVAKNFNNNRSNFMSYERSLIKVCAFPKHKKYEIKIDNRRYVHKPYLISIANGKSSAGGMLLNPITKITDDDIAVTLLDKVSFKHIWPSLYKIVSSKIDKCKSFKSYKGKLIEIQGDIDFFEADGLLFDCNKSVRIEKSKKKINFLC